jgi:hypothetical protein
MIHRPAVAGIDHGGGPGSTWMSPAGKQSPAGDIRPHPAARQDPW